MWSFGMTGLVAKHGTIVVVATVGDTSIWNASIWNTGMIVAAGGTLGSSSSLRCASVIRGRATTGSHLMSWRRRWSVRWNVSIANAVFSAATRLCSLGLGGPLFTTVLRLASLLRKGKD
jgi:hypothetical protein